VRLTDDDIYVRWVLAMISHEYGDVLCVGTRNVHGVTILERIMTYESTGEKAKTRFIAGNICCSDISTLTSTFCSQPFYRVNVSQKKNQRAGCATEPCMPPKIAYFAFQSFSDWH